MKSLKKLYLNHKKSFKKRKSKKSNKFYKNKRKSLKKRKLVSKKRQFGGSSGGVELTQQMLMDLVTSHRELISLYMEIIRKGSATLGQNSPLSKFGSTSGSLPPVEIAPLTEEETTELTKGLKTITTNSGKKLKSIKNVDDVQKLKMQIFNPSVEDLNNPKFWKKVDDLKVLLEITTNEAVKGVKLAGKTAKSIPFARYFASAKRIGKIEEVTKEGLEPPQRIKNLFEALRIKNKISGGKLEKITDDTLQNIKVADGEDLAGQVEMLKKYLTDLATDPDFKTQIQIQLNKGLEGCEPGGNCISFLVRESRVTGTEINNFKNTISIKSSKYPNDILNYGINDIENQYKKKIKGATGEVVTIQGEGFESLKQAVLNSFINEYMTDIENIIIKEITGDGVNEFKLRPELQSKITLDKVFLTQEDKDKLEKYFKTILDENNKLDKKLPITDIDSLKDKITTLLTPFDETLNTQEYWADVDTLFEIKKQTPELAKFINIILGKKESEDMPPDILSLFNTLELKKLIDVSNPKPKITVLTEETLNGISVEGSNKELILRLKKYIQEYLKKKRKASTVDREGEATAAAAGNTGAAAAAAEEAEPVAAAAGNTGAGAAAAAAEEAVATAEAEEEATSVAEEEAVAAGEPVPGPVATEAAEADVAAAAEVVENTAAERHKDLDSKLKSMTN